jgi:phosphoribosylformimino-5-aminoimidazole carboxamide ribotide isomerase
MRGRADAETVFSENPVATASFWQAQGAAWLHIVDLDGAFSGAPVNVGIIREICTTISIPVQLGGGIRDLATAKTYFSTGVSRIIIGTLALENPDAFSRIADAFPDRVGVSLDAEDGTLKTKGWVTDSGLTAEGVLPGLIDAGASFVIYTDISRDGMGIGVNAAATERLGAISSVPLIASGGIASMADIKALYPLTKTTRLEGAITGRAIYIGSLDLKEALSWIEQQEA